MGLHNYALGLVVLPLVLYYASTSINVTTAQVCYDTGNFTANSTYSRNRDLILSSLASNVTVNKGFYTTTIDEGPNKVYGLVLCRGDFSSENCSKCVNSGRQAIMEKCPNQRAAVSWGVESPPCIVRYSSRSIFGTMEVYPVDEGYNMGNITSNLTEFDQIWESLMIRVVTRASMGSSMLKFGTEEANLTSSQKIYALMQCAPYLSQTDCESCLRQSVTHFQSCCHGRQGGYVYTINCIFRWDLYPFYKSVRNTPVPSPPSVTKDKGSVSSKILVPTVLGSTMIVALVIFFLVFSQRRKQKRATKDKPNIKDTDGFDATELQFGFSTIREATNNFSVDNKLGKGGFGTVYKGRLPDGQETAVKRLSRNSGQGEQEFKNEVMLVAKLHHKNLARLLGFCLEASERLLIYEFMPNSSLDTFLFDPVKRSTMNWEIRYKIIRGIARGLLYLHEESRLRIVHRDLKASNILLDANMNAKISDFGTARLFDLDQTQGDTRRIVGTFGYMAAEYLRRGHYSRKSDVYSFGVLILEIISGQKNSDFHIREEEADLLTYAWESWREGTALDLVDPSLVGSRSEMMRCIHIGLLCVQEKVASRPTMASVVLMLTSFTTSLPAPSKPAYFVNATKNLNDSDSYAATKQSEHYSVNDVSITSLKPR